MKRTIYILIVCLLVCTLSCQKAEIPTWSGTDGITFESWLNSSNQPVLKDTLRNFSFYFKPAEKVRDTTWLTVVTKGIIYDYPRAVVLRQATSPDAENAVPNVHFVPFDDPELQERYVIPAGANRSRLPIILLRDASLKTTEIQLRIELEGNEFFVSPLPDFRSHRTIRISDYLSEPSQWSSISHMLGKYGPVKHEFMIKVTGKPIDDEYIKAAVGRRDYDYLDYLRKWFQKKLNEENARRASLEPPLGPLTENDEYRTVVVFEN